MVNPVIQAPQDPIANLGTMYVNGMQLSNDTVAPNTVLRVAVGQCRDYTNTNDIVINAVYNTTVVPPALVSNYVTANLAVSGVGGIDVGTVAASTMYAVYAIGSSANPAYLVNYSPINQVPPTEYPYSAFPGAVILSTNFTAPVLPAGYDMFRRIGTIVTDGSSHIVEFRQTGSGSVRTMWYGTSVLVQAAGHATGYTAVSLNALSPAVPTGFATNVYLATFLTPTAAGDEVSFIPTGAGAGSTYGFLSASVAGVDQAAVVECPCNASASISYKVSNVADSVTYGVQAFDDLL